jgi:DNA-binding transcriptional ArsR family regulator
MTVAPPSQAGFYRKCAGDAIDRPEPRPRLGPLSPGRTVLARGGEPRLTGKWPLAYNPDVADIFECLAAPARRAILDELHERDGQTLFELCARLTMKHGLGLTRQAISQHLAVLESAGLVTSRREGRYKFHYLNTDPLKAIVERWLKPGPSRS